MPCLYFLNVAVRPQLREHHLWLPGLLEFRKVRRRSVLAGFRVVALTDWSGLEEDDLRDAATHDERDDVVLRVVCDLHGPAVYIPDVAPARTLTDLNELAAGRRACLHHGGDVVLAADKLLRMRENGFARSEHDYFVVWVNTAVPIEVVLLERFRGLHCALHIIGAPYVPGMLLAPDVVEAVVVFGRLFAIEPLAERDVVA